MRSSRCVSCLIFRRDTGIGRAALGRAPFERESSRHLPRTERLATAVSRLCCPRFAGGHGGRGLRHDRLRRYFDRRGRHGYRQDVRLSGAGAAGRRQGIAFYRHQAVAGSAVPQRPAGSTRRTAHQRRNCSAEGPRQLCVSASHGARRDRRGCCRRREDVVHLRSIVRFAATTSTGDRAELAGVPENAAIWPLVTSTRDNCLGAECPRFGECFVYKARREAQAADIVVVNHHLFMADLAFRDDSIRDFLPTVNTVVLDEAHQLPSIAADFFGASLSLATIARSRPRCTRARTGARARRRFMGHFDEPIRACSSRSEACARQRRARDWIAHAARADRASRRVAAGIR